MGKINGIKDLGGICRTHLNIKVFKNKDLRSAVKVMGEMTRRVRHKVPAWVASGLSLCTSDLAPVLPICLVYLGWTPPLPLPSSEVLAAWCDI